MVEVEDLSGKVKEVGKLILVIVTFYSKATFKTLLKGFPYMMSANMSDFLTHLPHCPYLSALAQHPLSADAPPPVRTS